MCRRLSILTVCCALVLATAPRLEAAAAINIDSGNIDDCAIFMPPNSFVTFYVEVVLDNNVTEFQGMRFRIEGMPTGGLFTSVTILDFAGIPCDPIGCNIFGPEGIWMLWPSCFTDAVRRVVRIETFVATTIPGNTVIQVVGAPAGPTACPTLWLCDEAHTAVCVQGGSAIINPANGGCSLAVEGESWSGVKSLFRD